MNFAACIISSRNDDIMDRHGGPKMKVLINLSLVAFLSSCALTKTPQTTVNKKIEQLEASAWYQRIDRR